MQIQITDRNAFTRTINDGNDSSGYRLFVLNHQAEAIQRDHDNQYTNFQSQNVIRDLSQLVSNPRLGSCISTAGDEYEYETPNIITEYIINNGDILITRLTNKHSDLSGLTGLYSASIMGDDIEVDSINDKTVFHHLAGHAGDEVHFAAVSGRDTTTSSITQTDPVPVAAAKMKDLLTDIYSNDKLAKNNDVLGRNDKIEDFSLYFADPATGDHRKAQNIENLVSLLHLGQQAEKPICWIANDLGANTMVAALEKYTNKYNPAGFRRKKCSTIGRIGDAVFNPVSKDDVDSSANSRIAFANANSIRGSQDELKALVNKAGFEFAGVHKHQYDLTTRHGLLTTSKKLATLATLSYVTTPTAAMVKQHGISGFAKSMELFTAHSDQVTHHVSNGDFVNATVTVAVLWGLGSMALDQGKSVGAKILDTAKAPISYVTATTGHNRHKLY